MSVVCCDKCGQRLPRTLGERIRFARRNLEWSREAVEEKAGLSRGKVSKYERGLVTPSTVTMTRLSIALNVSADWLLRGRMSPNGAQESS